MEDLATQEPSSQCKDAGHDEAAKVLLDIAQGVPDDIVDISQSIADRAAHHIHISQIDAILEETKFEGSPQEPTTQRVEEASQPQATQEPSVANTDARVNPDESVAANTDPDLPLLVQPLSSQPMLDSVPGNFSTSSILTASMIIDSPIDRSSSIYMTSVNSSQPPLIFLNLLSEDLSSKIESKHLVKISSVERQSPELAKGEVDESKKPIASSEIEVTLQSNLGKQVSNDEIIIKNQRDLGILSLIPTGHQDLSAKNVVDTKLKGVALSNDPDEDVDKNDEDSSDSDPDDDDASVSAVLKRALKESQGGFHGSSSKFMIDAFPSHTLSKGKASQQFTLSDTTPDCVTKLRKHQWTHEWSLPSASLSFSEALHHAENTVSQISDSNLKDHLKSTSILAKGLKAEISQLQGIDSHSSTLTGILNSVAKVATKSQINTLSSEIKDIVSNQQEMSQHLISLDTRVTGIESSLQQIISLLSSTDVKKGEKEETTKCTPDLQLRKDDNSRNDGGVGSTSGTGTLSMFQGAKQTKKSKATAQSSSSRVKSKAKSQILMEEQQILTGDQILLGPVCL